MDQTQHTNGGQRFKLLPGGELPMRQYASHYPDLHWTHPPRRPFAYGCICCGQMVAISMDKHNCLFSIVTMFELKNLPKAPYGGQTLDEAVPAHPQPPLFLPCDPGSVCKTPLFLLSDNRGKTLSGWADTTHLLKLIGEAITLIKAGLTCKWSVFLSEGSKFLYKLWVQ